MRYFENGKKDKDATETYNQMLQHYRSSGKKKNGWVVEEKDDYTLISNNKNPEREIVIVTNKPNDKDLFAMKIKTRFFLHDEPNVTVIRGHSGRVDDISDSDKSPLPRAKSTGLHLEKAWAFGRDLVAAQRHV